MRTLLFALLLAASAARADTFAVAVVTSDPAVTARSGQALQLVERTLAEVTALTPKRPSSAGPLRVCDADPTCFVQVGGSLGADYAVLLTLKGSSAATVSIDAVLVDLARKKLRQQKARDVRLDAPGESLRTLALALAPPWTRRGWGGLTLQAPAGAKLRIDGRVTPPPGGDPIALTAGPHEADVTFASGLSLLTPVQVPEAGVLGLATEEPKGLYAAGGGKGSPALQASSAALWTAGTLAIAGSLVAGALAVSDSRALGPCTPQSRDCLQIDSALAVQRRVDAYNRTANILLISGSSAALLGAALFGLDLSLRPASTKP